jgi:hypothetical protein
LDFVSYDAANSPFASNADGRSSANEPEFIQNAIAASRLEDLHTYPFGVVTLPAGGRITRTLWKANVATHTLYRWSVGEAGNFQRIIRIRNSTDTPWPAGGVLLVTEGVPLAQVPLPFTNPGQEASLVLGAAEDLLHTFEVREIDREEVVPRPNVKTAAVTNEAVLSVTNTRKDSVDAELVYEVAGTVVDASGGTVRQVPRADKANPTSIVTWRVTLAPGERREWTVRFKQNLM